MPVYNASVNESARALVVRRVGGGFSSGSMSSGPFSSLGDFIAEVTSDEVFGFTNVQSRFTDIASVADAAFPNSVNNISFEDSSYAGDLPSSSTILPALLTDTVAVDGFSEANFNYAVDIYEASVVTDLTSSMVEFNPTVLESSVVTDSLSTLVRLFSTIVESSQASELCSTAIIINSEVNDIITATERLNTNTIVKSQIIEMSHAVDALVARRYWENINTAESAGWQLVQNNIGID